MLTQTMRIGLTVGVAAVAAVTLAAKSAGSDVQGRGDAEVRLALAHALPTLDGAHVAMKLLEVTYPPGGSSAQHRHPCSVVGYMLEGTMRMKVSDGPEVIYKAGDTFFEGPSDTHRVSANASDKVPARFLAYFTCDRETPLVVAVPDAKDASK